jgi:hypothetical protein
MTLLNHKNTATTKKLDFKNSHMTSGGPARYSPKTQTRTNTNPNDTEASAAGRKIVCVCSANGACENQGAWVVKSLTKSDAHVVVHTLEMHRGRRLTCGTRSFIIAEVKNGLLTHKAPPSVSWWQ